MAMRNILATVLIMCLLIMSSVSSVIAQDLQETQGERVQPVQAPQESVSTKPLDDSTSTNTDSTTTQPSPQHQTDDESLNGNSNPSPSEESASTPSIINPQEASPGAPNDNTNDNAYHEVTDGVTDDATNDVAEGENKTTTDQTTDQHENSPQDNQASQNESESTQDTLIDLGNNANKPVDEEDSKIKERDQEDEPTSVLDNPIPKTPSIEPSKEPVVPSPLVIDPSLLLLNELKESTVFGMYTDEHTYAPGQQVLVTIIAPMNTPVELLFVYNGYRQYVKIPESVSYPHTYKLPLPNDIDEGVYVLSAVMLYDQKPLKTQTVFEVANKVRLSNEEKGLFEMSEGLVIEEGQLRQARITNTNLGDKNDYLSKKAKRSVELVQDNQEESVSKDEPSYKVQLEERPSIGKKVRWKIHTTAKSYEEVQETLPESAQNILVQESQSSASEAAGQENANSIVIEFESPAPSVREEEIHDGDVYKKQVTIASLPEYEGEFEYKNIASSAIIEESLRNQVRLVWYDGRTAKDVTDDPQFSVEFIDSNNNGRIELVKWNTPHLSTQVFEIIVGNQEATGTGVGLDINLLEPEGGEIFNQGPVQFMYRVIRNSNATVSCNTSIDGEVIDSVTGVSSGNNLSYQMDEGQHNWDVSCSDSNGISRNSDVGVFSIDITPPEVTLQNPNNSLTLTGDMGFNFTASDNLAEEMNCTLFLNGMMNASVLAQNANPTTLLLPGIANGTYEWYIGCKDEAKNHATSSTLQFVSKTDQQFSVVFDKSTYRLGESGYVVINGPYGASVVLVVNHKDSGASYVRSYANPSFPVLEPYNFTKLTGEYIASAVLNYEGATKQVNLTLIVENNLQAQIQATAEDVEKDSTISFEAINVRGGIGELSYVWNFRDETEAVSGKTASHQFVETGNYNVELTITDSEQNSKSFVMPIKVMEKKDVLISVEDTNGVPVPDAWVYIEDEKFTTNGNGVVEQRSFPGEYTLLVQHPRYRQYYSNLVVEENTNVRVVLEPLTSAASESNLQDSPNQNDGQVAQDSQVSDVQEQPNTKKQQALALVVTLKQEVTQALEKSQDYSGITKEMSEEFGLTSLLEKNKNELERIERDLNSIDRLREEEKEERINQLVARLQEMKGTLIVDINAQAKNEYVQEMTQQSIEDWVNEYVHQKYKDLEKTKVEEYVSHITTVQKKVSLNVKLFIGQVITLDGKSSVALYDFELSKPLIPGAYTFVTHVGPHETISVFTPAKVEENYLVHELEDKNLKFMVYKEVTLEQAKNVTTLLVDEPRVGKGIASISGFSTLGDLGVLEALDDPVLVGEIAVIIALIIVYLVLQFDLLRKVKSVSKEEGFFAKLRFGKMNQLVAMQKQCHDLLWDGRPERAEELLGQVEEMAESFKGKKKEQSGVIIASMREEIRVREIKGMIDTALSNLKNGNHELAENIYKSIAEYYKGLSKSSKGVVSRECTYLYEKLTKER